MVVGVVAGEGPVGSFGVAGAGGSVSLPAATVVVAVVVMEDGFSSLSGGLTEWFSGGVGGCSITGAASCRDIHPLSEWPQ